jgi:hypothetical protein
MPEQVRDTRECENCHAEMRSVGKLPAIGGKPQIKVFRCSAVSGATVLHLRRSKGAPHKGVHFPRKSLKRASSTMWSVDKIAPTRSDCGAVWISYK